MEEVDENSFLVADGYTQEILLSGRSCVELKNPPPESAAGMIAALVRFLDNASLSWRPSEREAFESQVAGKIPE